MDPGENERLIAASAIHIIAAGGNLLVAYLLALAIRVSALFPEAAGFPLLGFRTTVTYNLLLPGEAFLTRYLPEIEQDTAGYVGLTRRSYPGDRLPGEVTSRPVE